MSVREIKGDRDLKRQGEGERRVCNLLVNQRCVSPFVSPQLACLLTFRPS